MKHKHFYVLYDKTELPVIVTSDINELSKYLGNSSVNSTYVLINKYLKKRNLNKVVKDKNGKSYKLYRYKE